MSSLTGLSLSSIAQKTWIDFEIKTTDVPQPIAEGAAEGTQPEVKTYETISFSVESKGWEWVARRLGAIVLGILAVSFIFIPLAFEGFRNYVSFLWNDKIVQPLTFIPKAEDLANKNDAEQLKASIDPNGLALLGEASKKNISEVVTDLYKKYKMNEINLAHINLIQGDNVTTQTNYRSRLS